MSLPASTVSPLSFSPPSTLPIAAHCLLLLLVFGPPRSDDIPRVRCPATPNCRFRSSFLSTSTSTGTSNDPTRTASTARYLSYYTPVLEHAPLKKTLPTPTSTTVCAGRSPATTPGRQHLVIAALYAVLPPVLCVELCVVSAPTIRLSFARLQRPFLSPRLLLLSMDAHAYPTAI